MDVSFECLDCGQRIAIDESGAGLQIDCPNCQSQLTVPRRSVEVPSQPLPAENMPQYRCSNRHCGGKWSEHQLLREEFKDRTILLCPKCRRAVTKITKPVPFWSRVAGAFAYPFLGNGIWMLASATLLLTLLEVAQMVRIMSFASLIASMLVAGCIGMLLLDVIRTTALDEGKTMEWPEVGGWDDLLSVAMQLGGSALLVFFPAMICGWLVPDTTGRVLSLCLWGLGAAYYPMALLAVAMSDSVSGINPLVVVPAIIKTLPQYLLVISVLAVIWLVYEGASALSSQLPWGLGLVIYLPVQFYSYYSLVVAGRLLGLLYQSNTDKLGWLD